MGLVWHLLARDAGSVGDDLGIQRIFAQISPSHDVFWLLELVEDCGRRKNVRSELWPIKAPQLSQVDTVVILCIGIPAPFHPSWPGSVGRGWVEGTRAEDAVLLVSHHLGRFEKIVVVIPILAQVLRSHLGVASNEIFGLGHTDKVHGQTRAPREEGQRMLLVQALVRSDHVASEAGCEKAAKDLQLFRIHAGMIEKDDRAVLQIVKPALWRQVKIFSEASPDGSVVATQRRILCILNCFIHTVVVDVFPIALHVEIRDGVEVVRDIWIHSPRLSIWAREIGEVFRPVNGDIPLPVIAVLRLDAHLSAEACEDERKSEEKKPKALGHPPPNPKPAPNPSPVAPVPITIVQSPPIHRSTISFHHIPT